MAFTCFGCSNGSCRLALVDSDMARLLTDTARKGRLMGVETMLAGLQPTLTITVVKRGLDIGEVRSVPDVDSVFDVLRKERKFPDASPGRTGGEQ